MNPEKVAQMVSLERATTALYPRTTEGRGLLQTVLAKEVIDESAASKQGITFGIKGHPFDMVAVKDLQTSNEHHSTCIHTKVSSTIGMGHVTEQKKAERLAQASGTSPTPRSVTQLSSRVDDILNPLCDSTWQETLWDVTEDFYQVGNGYLEVVRDGSGAVVGLHHLPAEDVKVFVEDKYFNRHYQIEGASVEEGGTDKRLFACFGDKEDFIERAENQQGDRRRGWINFELPVDDDRPMEELVSEVIHFRRPSSMSRWYGFPDWVSAVAAIELAQMLMQYNFDFFQNRGVPEFLLLMLGQQLDPKDWDKIKTALQGGIGSANAFKSIAANLATNENFRVELHKLGLEDSGEDRFSSMRENLAMSIVSAHRVPPLLAGIQIPGKLGATNELPNALMAFQILVVGPVQRLFQQTLGQTLGAADSQLDLAVEDFEFVKITEEINVGQMDTVARMRQSPMQAEEEGRSLDDGVRD